ncbi:MAG: GTP cyclohydrolase I [Bacteroidaceae bacterium]|nr:GTP cyclohydrolase I [Bacteroidaceae bacterium]
MEPITPNPQDIKRALRTLLLAIGEDPDRDGLRETPDRILRMWKEIFRGYREEDRPTITTFPNESGAEEMVMDAGQYYSMCEHHMLPFFGHYYFAYLPSADGRILGISKVARVVGYCAARLQLQERLARDVVEMLSEALGGTARGFAILMRGTHMCKTMRGVRNQGEMQVAYYTGEFKTDASLRAEFLQMVAAAK